MGLGEPSPWISVKPGKIDRTWHMMVQLLETKPRGLGGSVRTYTTLQARPSLGAPWVPVTTNRSISMPVTCFGYTERCVRSLLFWENDPQYLDYRVQLRFEKDHLLQQYLGDVEFEAVTTPDSYARLALGFKHSYGVVTLLLTGFWLFYMFRIKRWPYAAWNWEQRYLTVLLVGLNIYNNPVYGVQYASSSSFFPWWNAFAEILYVGLALALWLAHISRFKRSVMYENYLLDRQVVARANVIPHDLPFESDNAINQSVEDDGDYGHGPSAPRNSGGSDPAATSTTSSSYDPDHPHPSHSSAYYDPPALPDIAPPVNDDDPIIEGYSYFYLLMAGIYVVITGGLFLWSALRDRMTPVDTLRNTGSAFQLLYYGAAAFYTFLVILLTVKLSFNALGSRRHRDLLWGRYIFFAGPTMILAVSLAVGLFSSNVGPYATNMVGVLVYSAIFNAYVYFMVWAYWPSQGGGYLAVNNSETASIFTEGTSNYASNL